MPWDAVTRKNNIMPRFLSQTVVESVMVSCWHIPQGNLQPA